MIISTVSSRASRELKSSDWYLKVSRAARIEGLRESPIPVKSRLPWSVLAERDLPLEGHFLTEEDPC